MNNSNESLKSSDQNPRSGQNNQSKECFKVIHGVGEKADYYRRLAEETVAMREQRIKKEQEDAKREAYKA